MLKKIIGGAFIFAVSLNTWGSSKVQHADLGALELMQVMRSVPDEIDELFLYGNRLVDVTSEEARSSISYFSFRVRKCIQTSCSGGAILKVMRIRTYDPTGQVRYDYKSKLTLTQ